ncbi:MAG: thermonuclease family protein [Patescibacteria group bacterium]|nr:thermonuclease family protein [Patescibacteria group bacterium]
MIGIDTPETVDPRKTVQYFGIEASRYSKEKLTEAQVRIEFDQDIFDRYYRILGYVYLDSVLYNQKILEDGYAFAYTKYPFEKMEPFRQAEIFARENELGLWAPVSDQQQDRVVSEYMTNTQEKTKEEKQSLKQEKEQRKEDQEVSLVTKIKETILSDWLDTEIEHTQKSISKKTKSLSSQGLIHTNKVIRKKISNIAEIIFSNEKQDIEIEGIITKVLDSKHAYFAAGNRVFRLDAIGRDLGNI